ncbi:substrate-binding domain-containing protein [Paenibacillus sp. HJL G12]|uniref:Substrate-binding domain-containing protein n=1 Tax=Paenibacillus dendrobii TaxID=2691084 RepID=A0A7X3IFY9_9BACL|nr:substrate-binding domain-containing protein [Paenibacillus dendrobii]MWV43214.1 substrate-binding domain-containing protein [Paenibacillus dendrobii]
MRQRGKWILVSLLLVGLLIAVWGGYKAMTQSLHPKKPLIIYIPKSIDPSIEFWVVMQQGVMTAAKEFGADIRIMGAETEVDVEGQIRILDEAIATKPDAIMLAASDYIKLVPAATKVVNAGIPLIMVDSDVQGDLSRSFIATDNYEAGRKSARLLKEHVNPDEKIAIVSYIQGTGTSLDREKGVRDELEASGFTNINHTIFSDGQVQKSYEMTRDLLLKQPEIRGIVALNEPSTVGAGKAILNLGLQSKVSLIGFDNSNSEIRLIDRDVIQATVIQRPFNMGYLAVKTAVSVIKGQKVDKVLDTGSKVITKYNMYTNENQKLLFPFEDELPEK